MKIETIKQVFMSTYPLVLVAIITTVASYLLTPVIGNDQLTIVICAALWLILLYLFHYRPNRQYINISKPVRLLGLCLVVMSVVATASVSAATYAYIVYCAIVGGVYGNTGYAIYEASRSK